MGEYEESASRTYEPNLISDFESEENYIAEDTKPERELQNIVSTDSLNYLFHISDVSVCLNRKTKLKNTFKKKFGLIEKMSLHEFDMEVKMICNCCLKQIKDLHELHVKRNEAMGMINDVIDRMDVTFVKTNHVVHLVWSVMSCIHHFQLRFRCGAKYLIAWTRKRKAEASMDTYTRLIHVLPQETYRIILNSLIIFYKEGKLWTTEFRLTKMICELLYLYTDIEEALEDILSAAENESLSSEIEPRMLIKVLYEVLRSIKWSHLSEQMIKRFLIMWRKSIVPQPNQQFRYGPMRMALNICIRNITKSLNNTDLLNLIVIIVKKITYRDMEHECLLEFGSIGEYAALRYHTQRFSESIPEELMDNILTMMLSENTYHHLFAHRIIQNIMDRHFNRLQFEHPRIYFKAVNYNIRLARYSFRDRLFYKKHRNNIYHVLMAGLRHHFENRINLENIYTYLAITCVEIPCSYVASSIVSFAMAMQEFILQTNPKNMVACHHVHAIVMSLMSLVCYVHKAEVFYNYVALIMDRRSELAPQLNPPVKVTYDYALHHILWNKPDLFFEDWEARYGLWKCFRTSQTRSEKPEKKPEFDNSTRKVQKRVKNHKTISVIL